MSNTHTVSTDTPLESGLLNEIALFWKKGKFSSFTGVDDIDIHYAQFSQEDTSYPTIVIVPGRNETYLKYQELSFDLYQQGYSLFIIDHRGQGLSGRMLSNPHKGYVHNFQDYVDDLQCFVETIVTPLSADKPYLLAHSMGGAIATRFMQDFPNAIKAAVIASPMLGFYSGWIPKSIAKAFILLKEKINNMLSNSPWYFLGQKDYAVVKFQQNKLTHSQARYQRTVDLYQHNENIQLGGVTTHWLVESIAAQEKVLAKLTQLTTPILLLQAGEDTIVCSQAQHKFCQKLHELQPQSCPNGSASVIDNAYHELFFEVDTIRNDAVTQAINWFKKHH